MKNNLFSQSYTLLFEDTGDPTLKSSAELRTIQRNCVARNNPNTFYATVDPRPEPKVVWSSNTRAHFGPKEFTYSRFFDAIHPFWLPIYVGMVESTYRLVKPTVNIDGVRELIMTGNFPLRIENGKYFWYNQVSMAGTFDEKGALVEYFNEFHRLSEFDRMVPDKPSLTYQGNTLEAYEVQFKLDVGPVLEQCLKDHFSPASYKILRAYRTLKFEGRGTSREEVADFLGINVQALDKGNGRLLSQARLVFPKAVLTTVCNLASFLNDTFGMPLKSTSRRTL
ncbi:hypothetical protein FUA23_06265 [Neolewinella aurantiaca]|uniref:Uncharacterized protein n=1 Tax=Neolewinella aurantiaca TaxID=2602767 RepID=A0A5C7FYW8_9BACT|nr:hypothetical protein [Neolewinella aurantiaca]TXF90391.1 hypothetical protein FUA23_06265 [Neolewinella aurantiaca]